MPREGFAKYLQQQLSATPPGSSTLPTAAAAAAALVKDGTPSSPEANAAMLIVDGATSPLLFRVVPRESRPPPEAMAALIPPLVKLMVLVSEQRLAQLKEEASRTLPPGMTFVSTNDALVARLWQVGLHMLLRSEWWRAGSVDASVGHAVRGVMEVWA